MPRRLRVTGRRESGGNGTTGSSTGAGDGDGDEDAKTGDMADGDTTRGVDESSIGETTSGAGAEDPVDSTEEGVASSTGDAHAQSRDGVEAT